MAPLAFDTLVCARRLQQAGFTPEQAEAQVEIMAEAFLHNVDALVTRDYLDARLDSLVGEMNARFRFVYWTQGIIVLVVLIPTLRDLLL